MLKPCLAVLAIAAASCASVPPSPPLDGPVAGKWKSTMIVAGRTLASHELCQDTDASPMSAADLKDAMANDCILLPFKRLDGAIRSYVLCRIDDSLTASDIAISGDFASAYTTEIRIIMDPPSPEAPNPVITQMKMERLGDCDPKTP